MGMSSAKFTELPLPPRLLSTFCSSSSSYRPPFSLIIRPFSSSSSFRTSKIPKTPSDSPRILEHPQPCSSSSSWLNRWPKQSPDTPTTRPQSSKTTRAETRYFDETTKHGTTPIERIVLRLRNLGLSDEEEEESEPDENSGRKQELASGLGKWVDGNEEKLGDLLKRDWVRPDTMMYDDDENENDDDTLLPWERRSAIVEEEEEEEELLGRGRRRGVKAPTLAELTIEDEELRRLRRMGMTLRERVNVPKAGVTAAVLEKIHDKWRKNELVRLKFHEALAHDMKTAHEIVERRTGGLVIWRAGSVMVVYRGSNYEGPSLRPQPAERENDALFVPDVSSFDKSIADATNSPSSVLENRNIVRPSRSDNMTEEEAEYNSLLDGLGPRFEDWWGMGVLPVDADLLPQTIPGYKTPFRLLPTGMRSRLTNAEMTNLRKLAKSLPCHFALGRNRNHQGLAAAIVKLWERSLIVKIAVKRGIQNTNNKLMAEELKLLTGGVLLLRNKYYIVIYRGKDFLPPSVATALTERQELTKQIQDVEEKVRSVSAKAAAVGGNGPAEREETAIRLQRVEEEAVRDQIEGMPSNEDGKALAGTLAEFYEAQAQWGRKISAEEREKMIEEAQRSKTARVVKRLEHKLGISQAKKLKAERLLSKIVSSWVPSNPSDDLETITDEERAMYRRVGLRMKAYLPLGIRGVFDGVIENMHLHWKHRELVKLISKEKELAFAEETGRLLEYESGGILVAIERVPKGYAIIYYRGKNYRRPISLRPRNLLTKAKALKRRMALQRYEALSQHISELERTIEQTKREIGDSKNAKTSDIQKLEDHDKYDAVAELTESEDEDSWMGSDGNEDDLDWEDDENAEFSDFEEDN